MSATRATVAAVVGLLLAACTGRGEPAVPARPATPSLRLTVVSIP